MNTSATFVLVHGKQKDRHVRIGKLTKRAVSTGPSCDGFFASNQGAPHERTSHLFRWCDHLLAILVHQGSDPTPPYQTLVIRKSATLFLDFASWDS
jgi:hypothetical protein